MNENFAEERANDTLFERQLHGRKYDISTNLVSRFEEEVESGDFMKKVMH